MSLELQIQQKNDELNSMLEGKSLPLKDYLYISGDFTKSLAYAKDRYGDNYGGYRFFKNNCVHFAKNCLLEGEFNDPLERKAVESFDTAAPYTLFFKLGATQVATAISKHVESIIDAVKGWFS